MGVSYTLGCNTCKRYLDCGKLLLKNGEATFKPPEELRFRLQGFFSEQDGRWIDDVRCWKALGQFLIMHQEHYCLTFASDEVVLVQLEPYEPVDTDELLAAIPPESGQWNVDPAGASYNLVCYYTCWKYLHCGKLLVQDGKHKLGGLFSKKEDKWIDDARCWKAVGQFLIAHQGHCLIFANEKVVPVRRRPYEPIEFDTLLEMAPPD